MALENNRADFEAALEGLGNAIDRLDMCVDGAIMDDLRLVVSEYNGHLQGDIQRMADENEALKDRVEALENITRVG